MTATGWLGLPCSRSVLEFILWCRSEIRDCGAPRRNFALPLGKPCFCPVWPSLFFCLLVVCWFGDVMWGSPKAITIVTARLPALPSPPRDPSFPLKTGPLFGSWGPAAGSGTTQNVPYCNAGHLFGGDAGCHVFAPATVWARARYYSCTRERDILIAGHDVVLE